MAFYSLYTIFRTGVYCFRNEIIRRMKEVRLIRIYTLSVEKAAALGESAVQERLPSRHARALRMRSIKDRLLCLAAGHLLLGPLGIPEESVLRQGPFGKPAAEGRPPFSLSHSGRYAVLAVNTDVPLPADPVFQEIPCPSSLDAAEGAPVGVDIELVRPLPLRRMRGLLLPEEYAWAAGAEEDGSSDPVLRFFTLWTLKESALKAVGTGLHRDPRKLDALPLQRGEAIRLEDTLLSAGTQVFDGHVLSVCSVPVTPLRSSLPTPPATAP